MKSKLFFLGVLIALNFLGHAVTQTVYIGNGVGPDFFTMRLGDTVRFELVSGVHTIQGTTPPGTPPINITLDSTVATTYTYVPTVTGTYTFGCTNPWHSALHSRFEMRVEAAGACNARFDVAVHTGSNAACNGPVYLSASSNLTGNRYYWRQDTAYITNPNLTLTTSSSDSSTVLVSPYGTGSGINHGNIMLTVSNPTVNCKKEFYFQYLNTVTFVTMQPAQKMGNLTYQFSINSQFMDDLIVWNFGDGHIDTLAPAAGTTVSHTYSMPGNYTVTVVKREINWHCLSGNQQSLAVVATGIAGIKPALFDVYPVPAADQLNVTLLNYSTPTLLQLYDVTGRTVVQKFSESSKKLSLDVSRLPAGNYLLKANNGNDIQIRRVQINR